MIIPRLLKMVPKWYHFQVSTRANVTISRYVRDQVDELIAAGRVTTLASAIHSGLLMLIRQHKLQRWDDEIFGEYGSSILKKDPTSKVLISRQFQKDLNRLAKEMPGLRKVVQLTFKRLVGYFFPQQQTDVFLDKSLEIKQLELENYSFAEFKSRGKSLRMLLRHQGQELIACKLGGKNDQLWL